MRELLRKLKSEKNRGKGLKFKTFLTFDEKRLIVQVIAPNRLIERSFYNNETGEAQLKAFISKFKTLRDVEEYIKK